MENIRLFLASFRFLRNSSRLVAYLRFVRILLQSCSCVRCSKLLVDLLKSFLLRGQIFPRYMTCMPIIRNVNVSVGNISCTAHVSQRVWIARNSSGGCCHKVVRFLQIWVLPSVHMIEVTLCSYHVMIISRCTRFLAESIWWSTLWSLLTVLRSIDVLVDQDYFVEMCLCSQFFLHSLSPKVWHMNVHKNLSKLILQK